MSWFQSGAIYWWNFIEIKNKKYEFNTYVIYFGNILYCLSSLWSVSFKTQKDAVVI